MKKELTKEQHEKRLRYQRKYYYDRKHDPAFLEKYRLANRRSYLKKREKYINNTRQWMRDNPERVREYQKRYRNTHRGEVREYHQKYYQAHKEEFKHRAYQNYLKLNAAKASVKS